MVLLFEVLDVGEAPVGILALDDVFHALGLDVIVLLDVRALGLRVLDVLG